MFFALVDLPWTQLMPIQKYTPLLTGVMVPVSTFLNLQSITVPMLEDDYFQNTYASILAYLSLLFGVISIVALFIRMLEKKIKWSTRLVMIGSWSQGIAGSLSLLVFHAFRQSNSTGYTEAFIYRILASSLSLLAGSLVGYHIYLNQCHHQLYSWTLYELSLPQRQFILLTITSIVYMTIISALYSTDRLTRSPREMVIWICTILVYM